MQRVKMAAVKGGERAVLHEDRTVCKRSRKGDRRP